MTKYSLLKKVDFQFEDLRFSLEGVVSGGLRMDGNYELRDGNGAVVEEGCWEAFRY